VFFACGEEFLKLCGGGDGGTQESEMSNPLPKAREVSDVALRNPAFLDSRDDPRLDRFLASGTLVDSYAQNSTVSSRSPVPLWIQYYSQ
jgi:hypothetical protein